jgi:diguanylate cyclase (GGDEF)-like protein
MNSPAKSHTPRPGELQEIPGSLTSDALATIGLGQFPFCMVIFDTELRIAWANEAANGLGDEIAAARWPGRRLGEVLPALDAGPVEQSLRQVLATGDPVAYLEVSSRADGDPGGERLWGCTQFRIDGPDGTTTGAAHIMREVTDRARGQGRLALAGEASRRIGTTLDITQTAEELLEAAIPRLADAGSVDLLATVIDGDQHPPQEQDQKMRLHRVALRWPDDRPAPAGYLRHAWLETDPAKPTHQCLVAGVPVYLPTFGAMTTGQLTEIDSGTGSDRMMAARQAGAHSLMIIPLTARGVIMGVVVLYRLAGSQPFTTADLSLARELVSRAAISIDNAWLYTGERATALALQRGLFPRQVPQVPGLQPGMTSEAGEMAARLRAELPVALRGGQVVGYFQPEVELSSGRLVAAEVLARWEHPELGILQPAVFIPLVEELGLMGELSCLMVQQALAQHRAWAAAGWVVPVSVNIGPGDVADSAFPACVIQLLREEQVPGRMLGLEVSEETGTAAASAAFFAQLAGSGVRVSLDDFGTGFASLESLGGWPIDELKLDRSIVRPMATSASFHAIVATTIDLAHQLGVKVVAEGIENEAVSSELRALGCDIGQGFLLGRPMPAAAFTEWMRDPATLVPRLGASGYPSASLPGGEAGPRQLASGPAGRAARAVRAAVQPVGGRALAVAVTLMAAYGLWQAFRWGGRGHQALIGHAAFVPVIAAAALLAWRASRRAGLGRNACRAWRLLAIALLLYLAGDMLQLAYEAVLHRRAYPTWADAGYLAFYPIAFWGLISFRDRRRSRPERLRLLLEMGIEITGAWMVIWYVALGPAIAANGHLGLFNLASYAYPIGDLLLLFGTLAVLLRSAPPSSVLALRILAAGMLAYIAADVIGDHITAYSPYMGGDPVDTLWILALILMSLAAACQLRAKPAEVLEPLPKPAPRRPSLLSYLAIAGCCLLLAVIGLRGVGVDSLAGGLVAGAVALTFLVGARQYIILHDYGKLAARYRELASVDGTTGLYNRRHFMEAAEAILARAQRLGQPLVSLMIDVDSFKQINDTYGHTVGDRVLAEMAQACREHVRPDDIVGRYGGDEFIVIIIGITSCRATQIANQLARPAARVRGREGRPLTYSASIGIAECQPGWDLPALLTHADQAMYEAKRAGGGTWRLYDDTMGATQAAIRQAAAGPAPQAADRNDNRYHR